MTVQRISVSGYRSIRSMTIVLGPTNVIVGPNGCGKSNLYRSMYFLAQAANGRLAPALAEEGGMPSVLWAGERRRKGPVRMTLGVTLDDFSYELSCGLPSPSNSAFDLDPEIKEERVSFAQSASRRVRLLQRKGPSAHVRNVEGRMVAYPLMMSPSETALSRIREPHVYPELSGLRLEMNDWRFYHHFPTHASAPARNPQIGVRTPILSHDGHDLAAALQTILEIGDGDAVHQAIDQILPGATLVIDIDSQCKMAVEIRLPSMRRPLHARELSDGTLRYLYLVAALLSPRPANLIALNEPETSLHPDVIQPLARLIAQASTHSQMWVVTHSETLAEQITTISGQPPIRLQLENGETQRYQEFLVADDQGLSAN